MTTPERMSERIATPTPALPAARAEIVRSGDALLPRPEQISTREVLGVPLAMTTYDGAMDVMDGMVARRDRGYVCAVAVHAVTVAQRDEEMRAALLGSSLTVPDGMPLVWAVNLLGESLPHRVYGPELMRRYTRRCAEKGHRVWLYGGRDQGSLAQLALNLRRDNPGIRIVGGYSPPFRELEQGGGEDVGARVHHHRPHVLWGGTGGARPGEGE